MAGGADEVLILFTPACVYQNQPPIRGLAARGIAKPVITYSKQSSLLFTDGDDPPFLGE